MRHWVIAFIASLAQIAAPGSALGQPVAAQQSEPTIDNIRGDLFKVRAWNGVTVFLATPDGIVLADPLDRDTATWIRQELESRFPGVPVRYVVQTSHRYDRAEGASRFDDTAEIIAHQRFNDEVSNARDRLPSSLADLDRNGNGALEISELGADQRADAVRARDTNRDGRIVPQELYRFVGDAESSYSARRSVTLNGRGVELVHLGGAYGREGTALYFPTERVVFVPEQPDLARGFTFGSVRPMRALVWARTIASLDADTVLSGDGHTTAHADIVALQNYLDDLVAAVAAGYEAGASERELAAQPIAESQPTTPFHAQRQTQITEIYRTIKVVRVSMYTAGALSVVKSNADFCASFASCEWNRRVSAVVTGISVSRRRVVAQAEMTFARQSVASRTSLLRDDVFAHRATTLSLLGGYKSPPARALSYSFVGGVSRISGNSEVLSREKMAAGPFGGRRVFRVKESEIGLTGGADLVASLGRRIAVLVPLRLTVTPKADTFAWPGSLSLHAGVGLSFGVHRHVD